MAPVNDQPKSSDRPPESCKVALKEWSGTCAALASGRQSILLRKGGIAEEGGRFVPEHPAFWLYPTALHQDQQGLRAEFAGPPPAAGPGTVVGLSILAVVGVVAYLDRPEALDELREFHVWTDETVHRRFAYRTPGLWVLGVRVFLAPDPWPLLVTAEQVGCKSWVALETSPPTSRLVPGPGGSEFLDRMGRLRAAMDPASPGGDLPRDAG